MRDKGFVRVREGRGIVQRQRKQAEMEDDKEKGRNNGGKKQKQWWSG